MELYVHSIAVNKTINDFKDFFLNYKIMIQYICLQCNEALFWKSRTEEPFGMRTEEPIKVDSKY